MGFKEDVAAELSWLSSAIREISEATGVDSYHISLLKNAVHPAEAHAIERAIFLGAKRINTISLAELREYANDYHKELTGHEFDMRDELFEELIMLLRRMVKI